jgi:SAM-dependent methyltransferase
VRASIRTGGAIERIARENGLTPHFARNVGPARHVAVFRRVIAENEEARAGEMTVRIHPEQYETRALFSFVDRDGRRVLEIGCGDGRLTWRYADRAAHVTAIEPFAPALARARENLPPELVSHVTLCPITFDEFAAATASSLTSRTTSSPVPLHTTSSHVASTPPSQSGR